MADVRTLDNALVSTTTTGPGTYSLGSAIPGYKDFSALSSGDLALYGVRDSVDPNTPASNEEVVLGTYTSGSPSTLTRATVLSSSNGGSAVNWGPGTKYIYAVAPADYLNGAFNSGRQMDDVASASTINLDTLGRIATVDVTGTATIGTVTLAAGKIRLVRCTGASTWTHGSNLVLPGATSFLAAAGDYLLLIGYGSSVVRGQIFRSGGAVRSVTVKTSGSGTYNTPAGCRAIIVTLIGGGAGGDGGNNGVSGGGGGNTTFSTLTAGGGPTSSSTTGGTASGGNMINIVGGTGTQGQYNIATNTSGIGGPGAPSCLGGAGAGRYQATGTAAAANSGSGGGGGGVDANSGYLGGGKGGSAGGYIRHLISSPASSYSYAVGAGGSGGSNGTSGYSGGAGGSGVIIIEELY